MHLEKNMYLNYVGECTQGCDKENQVVVASDQVNLYMIARVC